MTKNPKSRPRKKKRQRKSNQPLPAKNPNADFVPQEIAITGKTGARMKVQSYAQKQEKKALESFKQSSLNMKKNTEYEPEEIDETNDYLGTSIGLVGGQQRPKEVIVGGVQPPKKTKADFVPTVTDETTPGESIGIIGVSRPPKKTTRQRS